MKGGDDLYLMPENLRYYIEDRLEPQGFGRADKPLMTGSPYRPFTKTPFVFILGGPGYTMNRASLYQFYTQGLPHCTPTMVTPNEDRMICHCFERLGVPMTGTCMYVCFVGTCVRALLCVRACW